MKRCAATCCREPVSKGMLFCRDHWDRVPARTRSAILNAWRGRHMQAYAEAFDAARNHLDLVDGRFEDISAPPPQRWVTPDFLGVAR